MAKKTHCDRCDKVVHSTGTLAIEVPARMVGVEGKFGTVHIMLKVGGRLGEGANLDPLDLCPKCQNEIVALLAREVDTVRDPGGTAITGSRRF